MPLVRRMRRMRRMRSAFVLLALLVAGCAQPAAPDSARPPDSSHEEITDVPRDGFFNPAFGADAPFRVRATYEVLTGGPIDVFLATETQCALLGMREFTPTARSLNRTSDAFEAEFTEGGGACLMIDNASFGYGEAAPVGDVRVRWRLDVWVTA